MISVVMPVFNGEKFLKMAIESILNQTYTDFELVIINDGSTDKSAEIVKSYQDTRIHFLENDGNKGIFILVIAFLMKQKESILPFWIVMIMQNQHD